MGRERSDSGHAEQGRTSSTAASRVLIDVRGRRIRSTGGRACWPARCILRVAGRWTNGWTGAGDAYRVAYYIQWLFPSCRTVDRRERGPTGTGLGAFVDSAPSAYGSCRRAFVMAELKNEGSPTADTDPEIVPAVGRRPVDARGRLLATEFMAEEDRVAAVAGPGRTAGRSGGPVLGYSGTTSRHAGLDHQLSRLTDGLVADLGRWCADVRSRLRARYPASTWHAPSGRPTGWRGVAGDRAGLRARLTLRRGLTGVGRRHGMTKCADGQTTARGGGKGRCRSRWGSHLPRYAGRPGLVAGSEQ